MTDLPASKKLLNVKYEIRGDLARRALELESNGSVITYLNIGNPGNYGLGAPERIKQSMAANIASCDAYTNQKGIFPAREAIIMQQQSRGIMTGDVNNIFMGNGVSELIDITLRALLNDGDEVLIPSPDYPLWTAATILNGGKPVHYPCHSANNFIPVPTDIEKLITPRTRALVLINPNNPTGSVYPKEVVLDICKICKAYDILLLADEIYDHMTYDDHHFIPASSIDQNLTMISFSGLSKVYRACGYRVGWLSFTGDISKASGLINAIDLLAALRLCSNVPGQWAVQTALGGYQSIGDLVIPGGRLFESRRAIIDTVMESANLSLVSPAGAMYAFIEVKKDNFDDYKFALALLNEEHILVVPGRSFNYSESNAFRITMLPEPNILKSCIQRIDNLISTF
jgi:alanine-synthesizing transaminase